MQALEKRFEQSDFDDPKGELAKLHQPSSVATYQKRFEALLNRVVGLTDEFLLHYFMSGLKDEIWYMLKLLRPASLTEAIGLANTEEAHLAIRPCNLNQSRPTVRTIIPPNMTTVQGSSSSNQFTTPLIKTILYEAMKEHKDKGLYYYCDEKFWPGHRYKTQTLEDNDMDCSDD